MSPCGALLYVSLSLSSISPPAVASFSAMVKRSAEWLCPRRIQIAKFTPNVHHQSIADVRFTKFGTVERTLNKIHHRKKIITSPILFLFLYSFLYYLVSAHEQTQCKLLYTIQVLWQAIHAVKIVPRICEDSFIRLVRFFARFPWAAVAIVSDRLIHVLGTIIITYHFARPEDSQRSLEHRLWYSTQWMNFWIKTVH